MQWIYCTQAIALIDFGGIKIVVVENQSYCKFITSIFSISIKDLLVNVIFVSGMYTFLHYLLWLLLLLALCIQIHTAWI